MILLGFFKVTGHSMEPSISQHDKVLVSNVCFIIIKPKIGNIIAFKKNNKIFIKRIIKIKGEKYFVKGDNLRDSLDSDKFGWILKKDILGKVISKI